MTTEQDLTARLKVALVAHQGDILDGKCDAQQPSRPVLDRHRAVAEASEKLMAWWASQPSKEPVDA